MDRANAAEWLLCQVMSTERASELVGDILESRSNDRGTRFWISIASLMICFSWRTILGVFLSPLVSMSLALIAYIFFTALGGNSYFRPDSTAQMYLFGISILFWEATVISLVRFKFRSPYIAVTLAACLACTVTTYCLFAAHGFSIITSVVVIFLFFCASKRLRLRSLGALLCTITISWLTAYGLSEIDHDPRSIFSALSGLMELLVVPFVANSSTSFFCGRMLNEGKAGN
jgi:hypothetical protein